MLWRDLLGGLGLVLLATALGFPSAKAKGPLRIVATIPPYAMLARAVGGERSRVHVLLRRGHDPHQYEPGIQDLVQLQKAHLVISNGIGQQRLEAQLHLASRTSGHLRMGKTVSFDPIRDASGALNGHIWLDPDVMARGANILAKRLGKLHPEGLTAFQANAQAFQEALSEADRRNQALLAQLPVRHVVTLHPGFDYFLRHYHLETAGSYLDLAGNEPSPRQMAELLQRIRELAIPAIFREPQLPRGPAEALAEAAGIRVGILDPLGFQESVSSYPDLLRYNAHAIHDAYTR